MEDISNAKTLCHYSMIVAIVVSFLMPSAYHLALIYVSAATMFFLVYETVSYWMNEKC